MHFILNFKMLTAIIKLGIVRTFFNITPIVFVWKKKLIYTQDDLNVSKSCGNFHFLLTIPLSLVSLINVSRVAALYIN